LFHIVEFTFLVTDCLRCLGPASVGTVDMNDMNDMNGGLEAGDLPAHMDTTDDLVPTLDVRTYISQCHFDLKQQLFLNSWEKSYRRTS
jgi:hypothetical protein